MYICSDFDLKLQYFLKIIIGIAICCFIGINSSAQELISNGILAPINYSFTGKQNYQSKKTLTHALAYSYSKDVGEIKAEITYQVHFKTLKIEDKGFKTIVRLGPKEVSGHTDLLSFDFKNTILPNLKSISLYMYKDEDLIYVKHIADLRHEGKSLYFTFLHQRFNKSWKIELRNPIWEFDYNETSFNYAWEQIANYQIAVDWLDEIKNFNPNNKTEEYIFKFRSLKLLASMKQLELYWFVNDSIKQDPQHFIKQLDICIFKFQKDIDLLQSQIEKPPLKDFANYYFSFEEFIFQLYQNNSKLYGTIYQEFDTKDWNYFAPDLLVKMLSESERKSFENLYQKQALVFINQMIENKQTPEALYQLQRFQTFYQNSSGLEESGTFKHFKARAVYDIYLSYIQVSKQALEHNQIDMAINYLDQASDIQDLYSTEIINNILVENEMRQLIKKALSKYQNLLDEGQTETAQKVKEGILGLMKKLGISSDEYPIG